MKAALIALCVTLLINAGLSLGQTPLPTPAPLSTGASAKLAFQQHEINDLKTQMANFIDCYNQAVPIDFQGDYLQIPQEADDQSIWVVEVDKDCLQADQ